MTLPPRIEAMLKQIDAKYQGFDPVGTNLVKATAEKTIVVALETFEVQMEIKNLLQELVGLARRGGGG